MEEIKKKKAVEPAEGKLSYEQLENVANQLSAQLQQARAQLQQINTMFTRADYLFKVMQFSINFDPDFVEKCAKEIQEFMTPEPETQEEITDGKSE